MLAKTEQGRQIRQYFIEAEKKWKLVQEQYPAIAQQIELQHLVNTGHELELKKHQAELALLQFRHFVDTALPEPSKQKILGYQTVKEIEYRDRIIKGDEILNDGSTVNKTYLCKRFGFITKSGSPNYKLLEYYLSRLPQDAFDKAIYIRENPELKREYLSVLDEIVDRENNQRWLGEDRPLQF